MKKTICLVLLLIIFGLVRQAPAARVFFDTDGNPATEETTLSMRSDAADTKTVDIYVTGTYAQIAVVQIGLQFGGPGTARISLTPWNNQPSDPTHPFCFYTYGSGLPWECD